MLKVLICSREQEEMLPSLDPELCAASSLLATLCLFTTHPKSCQYQPFSVADTDLFVYTYIFLLSIDRFTVLPQREKVPAPHRELAGLPLAFTWMYSSWQGSARRVLSHHVSGSPPQSTLEVILR